jgi:hypothetical protein
MLEVFFVVVFYVLLLPAAVIAVSAIINELFDPMTKIKNLLERRQQKPRHVDWEDFWNTP